MPGDSAYASRLEQIRPRLLTALRRRGARESERDDILQQAMIKLHRRQSHLENLPLAELLAYATRAVIGSMRNSERTVGRRRRLETEWTSDIGPDVPTGEELLARKQSFGRWLEALTGLPQSLRDVIIACDVHDLSHAAAARQLALPLGTIKSRLRRARDALERAWRSSSKG